ncbi:class I SAM-dependent methyltransferase [Amycolatopsis sp. NPDC058986]|uniref:class I SAM-dependent methyltransferase n=1 Tax=unclassified Amycolatopsis TaxID=2618356 RepID=UPI00366BF748
MNEPAADPDQELRARRAAWFGSRAAAYARHRPGYPRKALSWGLSGATPAPLRIVDLAAGTGKVSIGLLELGSLVTAVEPDPDMLAEFSRLLPEVTAMTGTAENIPLPDGSADAVVIGQAFHWFDADAALAEMARVIRPGGVVVALWNHDDESVPWVAKFRELTRTGVSRVWLDNPGEVPTHRAFDPFEREIFRHSQRRTAESLVETVATHSHMLVASPEEANTMLSAARAFLESNPETGHGEFDLPIITSVFRARRR